MKLDCYWGECETYFLTQENVEDGLELELKYLEHSWYIQMSGIVSERTTIMNVENLEQVLNFMNSKNIKIDERRKENNQLIIGVDKDEILLEDLTVINSKKQDTKPIKKIEVKNEDLPF